MPDNRGVKPQGRHNYMDSNQGIIMLCYMAGSQYTQRVALWEGGGGEGEEEEGVSCNLPGTSNSNLQYWYNTVHTQSVQALSPSLALLILATM